MTGIPDPATIMAALASVPDPCAAAAGLELSILDLGLVYDVTVEDGVEITITFTELGCQFTHRVVTDVISSVRASGWDGIVRVRPCWDPPWTPERLSPRAVTALAAVRHGYPRTAGPRRPVLVPLQTPPGQA